MFPTTLTAKPTYFPLTNNSLFSTIKTLSFSQTTFKYNKNPTFINLKNNLKLTKHIQSSLSLASHKTQVVVKPEACEVARTIMELSSVGTLSTLTNDGSPICVGVRFAVDNLDGTPILSHKNVSFLNDDYSRIRKSSFHVQLEQSGGLRTPQCTIQGTLIKPQQDDPVLLKKLHSTWEKKFGEALNEDFIYIVSVEKVIQMDDFMEDGNLVTSSDYKAASPDPLRDFAERIVHDINTHNKEDVRRFCNIYVDMDFLVKEAQLVWVDRLGFDMRLWSIQNDTFEVRIPFPREVTDEKGVKSSFNGMSQLAWEVEKNYYAPDFDKVKQLKKISSGVH